MLNKNLVKQGFLSPGLLLVIPATTTMNVESSSAPQATVKANLPVSGAALLNDTLKTTVDSQVVSVPLTPVVQLNKHAVKFVNSFVRKEDEFLQKMKSKSPSYFRVIHSVFEQYGIPLEMKYLAIVESQLKTTAVSRVGAKGMWQFMPVTARELGLKVSGKTDERTHFYKSTVAAAKYLKSLYAVYGDWLLVLAAYNGGPGTVDKAIKKSGSRNFWALQRFLPEESRGHVKRFIGIHYFFEGKGSITTQTKAEALAFQKKLEEYTATVQLKQVSKDTVAIVAVTTPVK